MPLSTQSAQGFQQTLQSGITTFTNRIKNFGPNSVAGAIVNAVSAMLLFLQSQAQYIVNVTRAATSTGVDLTSFVTDYQLSPPRLLAIPPQGQVTFSKFQAAIVPTVLPVGTVIQTNASPPSVPISYQVIADTSNGAYNAALNGYVCPVNGTSVSATCQAIMTPGDTQAVNYNALAGTLSVIVSSGVPFDSCSNANDITNGVNQETDAALRVRFQYYIQSLSKATRSSLASAIASTQAGLTFTINDGLDQNGNPKSAYFTAVIDDGSGAISSGLLANIGTALDAVRAAGISRSVIAPTNITITINVTGTTVLQGFTTTGVRNAIQTALINYVNANGVGGYSSSTGVASGKLSYVGVANVVASFIGSGANQGLSSYGGITINSGTTDITLTTYQLARTASANVTVN